MDDDPSSHDRMAYAEAMTQRLTPVYCGSGITNGHPLICDSSRSPTVLHVVKRHAKNGSNVTKRRVRISINQNATEKSAVHAHQIQQCYQHPGGFHAVPVPVVDLRFKAVTKL